MKKNYILALLLGSFAFSNAQTQVRTTGDYDLSTDTTFPLTLKVELNATTSLATITMTGPSSKWFAVGFNASSMTAKTDVICYGTSLLDQVLPGGHSKPTTDTTNNLTLLSNTVNGSKRTIVATRPLSTGDANDFTFSSTASSLKVIWAVGSSTNVGAQHAIFSNDIIPFTTTLGNEDFEISNHITVSPNPSNGVFTISNEKMIQVTEVKVFDINAKLVKEITFDKNEATYTIDASEVPTGVYFIEITTANDKLVKKIQINK